MQTLVASLLLISGTCLARIFSSSLTNDRHYDNSGGFGGGHHHLSSQCHQGSHARINAEYMRANIFTKEGYAFRIIQLHRDIQGQLKIDNPLAMLFTLQSLFWVNQMICQWQRSHYKEEMMPDMA
ncbi:hypothetical protein [Aeromonas enterica]